jgi:Cu/Zn superoxide dismutase
MDLQNLVSKVTLLLGAALVIALAGGASAEAQQAKSTELQLTESRNSGVSGTATLKDVEEGVEVTLNMQGLPEAGVEHLNHIHAGGTCADDRAGNPAPATIPLTTITAEEDGTGTETTTLDGVTLDKLQEPSEQRYIAFHAEQEAGGGIPPVIACADLTTAKTATSGRGAAIKESTQPLPKSGGLASSSMLLSTAALLLGLGVLAFGLLKRD